MAGVKKRRASKARTLTRRIKALNNVITDRIAKEDIHEKINAVKYDFEELGSIQDEVIELIQDDGDDGEKTLETDTQWYEKYEKEINYAVARTRKYIASNEVTSTKPYIKIKKLTIPLFDGNSRSYLKWKETFERYTDGLSKNLKYDYLLENTKNRAHEYVLNCSNFDDAISQLDKEYGI